MYKSNDSVEIAKLMSRFNYDESKTSEVLEKYDKLIKLVDLHTHTSYSDGTNSPLEVLELAKKSNVGVLSITDHDTIEGIRKYKNVLHNDESLKFVDGVELSVKVNHGRMHILGYGIDIDNKYLNDKLSWIRENKINSFLTIYEEVKREYNLEFSNIELVKLIESVYNEGNTINRVDIAKMCVKYGYASDVKDAFNKYLITAYENTRKYRKGINYKEAINVINLAHGVSVLAHPKSLELDKKEFLILLKELIKCGLGGIEVYHSSHTNEEMKFYKQVCLEYNLFMTVGSDYHGNNKKDVKIGSGVDNNLNISVLELKRLNNNKK